jgi:hypothetical protein
MGSLTSLCDPSQLKLCLGVSLDPLVNLYDALATYRAELAARLSDFPPDAKDLNKIGCSGKDLPAK